MDNDPTQVRTDATLIEVTCPVSDEYVQAVGPEPLVVLPLREDEKGNGIYPESTVTLVKRLRRADVSARYLHPPERRRFEGRNGFISDAVITIILGVVSNATWAYLRNMISRKPEALLKVTFGKVDRRDGDSVRWYQVEGDATDVIAAIDKLMTREAELVPNNELMEGSDASEDTD